MRRLRSGGDKLEIRATLGVQLFDAVTRANRLVGPVAVSAKGIKEEPLVKESEAVFVFMTLPDGKHTIQVRSDEEAPYYRPVDFEVSLPTGDPKRPTYPDEDLADQTLPYSDPNQAPDYLDQRDLATLLPTTAYPFPPGTTLLRGTVRNASANPVSGARVLADRVAPPDAPSNWMVGTGYTTGPEGEYVLFFTGVPGTGEDVTVEVDGVVGFQPLDVRLVRGETVVLNLVV